MSSTWKLDTSTHYPTLERHLEADVAIVGAGLAGLWCAYFLAAAGKKVVVLEQDVVGGGITSQTTAFVTQVIDTPLAELVEMFGIDAAQDVWRSGQQAIDLIEETIKREDMECEFTRTPLVLYARSQAEYMKLAKDHILADRLGFKTELRKRQETGFSHEGVLEVRGQAKFHPAKFIYGLARAATDMGVEIFEHSRVEEVVGNAPVKAVTSLGKVITAQDVVVTTYEPLGSPRATRFKKGKYTSYVLEYRVPKGTMPEGMYVDLANPYHYLRVDDAGGKSNRLLIGGEDHRSEIAIPEEKSFKALKEYARDLGLPVGETRPTRRWRGAILESSDGLALIGQTLPRHFVATAFSGNGMTYAALSGWIISDAILGNENPYKDLYDPRRRLEVKAVLYKARDYTSEFFGGALRNIFR